MWYTCSHVHHMSSRAGQLLDLCSGLPFRDVLAIFSSSFSLIDEAIDLEAPLRLLLGVSPRLAERAAPAAFCWAADLAGMVGLLSNAFCRSNAATRRAILR